jgi:SAM-dependent methyltransferase
MGSVQPLRDLKPRGLSPGVKLGIEIAKNAVALLPIARPAIEARRRRRGLGAIGSNDPEYSRRVFAYQEALISKYRSISGKLLGIGPGRSLGVAALFVKAGCSAAVAVDVDPWLDATEKFYEQLDVVDVLDRVAYVCPMPLENAAFPDDYFDLIVSHVVAEYFRDPDTAVWNIVRMLAPGGVSLHQIRLQGHWTLRDPSGFLRPSERAWHMATSHRRGQPNRWRLSDWAAAFERHGAPIVETEVPRRAPISAATRERFAPEFRTKSLEDLSIYNARILSIKPA